MNRSSFLRRIAALFAFIPFARSRADRPKPPHTWWQCRAQTKHICNRTVGLPVDQQGEFFGGIAKEIERVIRGIHQTEDVSIQWISTDTGGFFDIICVNPEAREYYEKWGYGDPLTEEQLAKMIKDSGLSTGTSKVS